MIDRYQAAILVALAVIVSSAAPMLCCEGAASAQQVPMVLAHAEGADAGGTAGEAASKEVCAAPHRYVDLINAGKYDQIGGLFADDAVYMGPDGKTRYGSKEIGKFYIRFLKALKPQVKPVSFIQDSDNCVMELASHDKLTGKYSLVAIDHFTIDRQGRISRFIVYLRPGTRFQDALKAALDKAQ